MILSVSRRTDIPAYYSTWFFHRLAEGFVHVKNPINQHQIRRIPLTPEIVDCIVFWSKNPRPMLKQLHALRGYCYYFQFTITAYSADLEPGLPPEASIIDTFRRLSEQVGPERILWRYDPILVNPSYTVDTHISSFAHIAKLLAGYTDTVTISFLDYYTKISKNLRDCGNVALSHGETHRLAQSLAQIGDTYGLTVLTCAEAMDLSQYGIGHARCIDKARIERLTGCSLATPTDKNQRKECGCAASVDIGAYNSCPGGCIYCYANHSCASVQQNRMRHNTGSPLLIGETPDPENINVYPARSDKLLQQSLYEI